MKQDPQSTKKLIVSLRKALRLHADGA